VSGEEVSGQNTKSNQTCHYVVITGLELVSTSAKLDLPVTCFIASTHELNECSRDKPATESLTLVC